MESSGILEKLEGKKLIIFGAGIAGVGVLKLLKHYGLKAEGFFDNQAETPYTKENLTVEKFDLSKFDPKETLFILAIHNMEEAIAQLKPFNLNSVLGYELIDDDNKNILSFNEYQKLESTYFYYEHIYRKKGINIDSLDLVITERCSLKCKECSNLMQFYEKPEHIELEDLKNTLYKLTNIVDNIYEIRLIGGEPFVYPHFEEILNYVASEKKIKRISIFTNGTVMPKVSTLNAIKSSGAWLSISDYGALSKKLIPLREKLNAMNIPYEVKYIDYWTKCADFTKHNRTFEETKQVFASCCAKTLITLLHGKIYVCPFIANAMNLKAIPNNGEDYIDLLSTETNEELRRKLIKFMERQGFASCDYCNGRPIIPTIKEEDKIPPHEQITMAREYIKYINGEDTDNPLVSVIIPAYNAEKYIERSMKSVLEQTYKNLELIVVNDDSTDNTEKIILSNEDKRIIYRNLTTNKGVSAARNVGLELANGEYVLFLDADDWFEQNALEEAVNCAKNVKDAKIICFNSSAEDAEGVSQKNFNWNLEEGLYKDDEALCTITYFKNGVVWGKLFTRKFLDGIRFDTDMEFLEDFAFLWEAFNRARNIYLLDKNLYHYFLNPNSVTHDKNLKIKCIKNIDLIVKIYKSVDFNRKKLKERLMELMLRYLCANIFYFMTRYDSFVRNTIRPRIEVYQEVIRSDKSRWEKEYDLSEDIKARLDVFALSYKEAAEICKKEWKVFLEDLRKFVSKNKKVYLYGNGNFTREMKSIFKENNLKFDGITVSSKSVANISGGGIISIDDFKDGFDDIGFVLTMTKENNEIVKKQLIERGALNIFDANRFGTHI